MAIHLAAIVQSHFNYAACCSMSIPFFPENVRNHLQQALPLVQLLQCNITAQHEYRYNFLVASCTLQYNVYRVSQEECARLRESVPYVKLYRYNPKHLYPKLNGYGDNGQRSMKL